MFFLRIQAVCLLLSFSLFAEEITGRVVRVADGDTITILVTTGTTGILPVAATPDWESRHLGGSLGQRASCPLPASPTQYKIRLHGIDAPEKKQAFGNASRKFLSGLVANREVRVTYTKRDRYGRIVGIVYLDGRDVNLEMLKAGLAWHYKKYDSTPAYAQAEAEARAAKRGLWQDKSPIEPESFRKAKRAMSTASVK